MSDDAEELFVLVDDVGRPVGTATRAACHGDPSLVHLSIHVVVLTPHGVLWQLRGADKDVEPDRWTVACSGHVSAGEDAREAAARELREEIGVEIAPEQLELLDETLMRQPEEAEWTVVFRAWHPGPFTLAPPEVAGLAVRPPDSRPGPLSASASALLELLDEAQPGWDRLPG